MNAIFEIAEKTCFCQKDCVGGNIGYQIEPPEHATSFFYLFPQSRQFYYIFVKNLSQSMFYSLLSTERNRLPGSGIQ